MADLIGLAELLGAGLAVVIVAVVWFTAHRLRHPPRKTEAWAASRRVPADPGELDPPRSFRGSEVTLDRFDVPVWEIDGDDPEGPAVILTPGWGDSRLGALARLTAITPWASTVIAWDPPGLGATPGACGLGVSEPALLAELAEHVGSGRAVVLFGWSLGAGVSLAAAERSRGVSAVIAESPYRRAATPARNVLRAAALPYRINLPVALALVGTRLGIGPWWRGFDRAAIAARVRVPVLVIHGSADTVSPPADGRDIADAAPLGALVEIDGAGHNDLWTDAGFSSTATRAVSEFSSRLRGSPAGSPG